MVSYSLHNHIILTRYVDDSDLSKVAPLVSQIIQICTTHDYPILLGKTMKNYLDRGVPVLEEDYSEFWYVLLTSFRCDFRLYMDKCKGLEKDALRFLFAGTNSDRIIAYI